MQGANHTGTIGYYGPKPPAIDHRITITFKFALDRTLHAFGFQPPGSARRDERHVLAKGDSDGDVKREEK